MRSVNSTPGYNQLSTRAVTWLAILLATATIAGCGGGDGTRSIAPIAQAGALATAEDTPSNGMLVATDADSSTLSYSIVSQGNSGTATITDAATGDYTYTPNLDANGDDTFTFKANDGSLDSNIETITVTITPVNDPPVAQTGTLNTDEDTPANGMLVATDVDNTTLSYSIVSNGSKGTATITDAATGAYTYTPNLNASGSDTFTFMASDGSLDSNIATISIAITAVNDAPVARVGDALNTAEDTPANGVLVATDMDSPMLAYSIVSTGSKGMATITDATTGSYTYTPNLNANGSDTFSFKANDGSSDSNIATVTVTITPVNDAPVAQAGTLNTAEDTPANGMLVATDVDSSTLSYSIVSTGSKGTATITNVTTGAYTYTPNLNASGSDTFTFKANDGSSDSNIATVTVTITPVNDAPVAQAGTLATDEDTPANGMLVATDVDNTTLSYSIVSNGSKGTATITDAATGAYTYTPNLNASGSDTFTFKANDGSSDSNTATITVTINAAPVAQANTLDTDEDTLASGMLVATDVDNTTLSYSIVSNGSKGTATITDAATGAYTYTPNLNANGADTFSFKANDGSSDSNIATITVTINPSNDAPVAQDNTLTTAEDTPGDDVLVATDVDNTTLTYSIVSQGSNGTATITNTTTGSYTYTPNLNANGPDTFSFKANDGSSDSNIATVTVTITPVNDPPVAAGSCGTTPQALAVNGTLGATDPDTGEALTYSLNADGSGGAGPIITGKGATVTLNTSTGAYIYTPATGAGDKRGLDSFGYRVTDLASAFSTANETIIIDQKIMPLGDSITHGETWIGPLASDYLTDLNPAGDLVIGYRKSLFESLDGAGYTFDFVGSRNGGSTYLSDTDHEGHDGWTAVEIAFGGDGSNANHDPAGKVQAWLDSNPADIILLHAGTNDLLLTDKYDIENILDEIDTWAFNNSNPITVFLALIIDQNPIEPYVTTFNTEVQTMVAGRTWSNTTVNIVDQHSALNYPTDLSEDTAVTGKSALHPNDSGYTKMAGVWSTALEAVLDKCP